MGYHMDMDTKKPHSNDDWIAISLRWFILLGLMVTIVLGEAGSVYVALLLLAGGVWNLSLTYLILIKKNKIIPRTVHVAVDMGIAYLVFILSGCFLGNLGWVGLLPVVSGAAYFGITVGITLSLVNVVLQGLIALFYSPPLTVLIHLAVVFPLYTVSGIVISSIQRKMNRLSTPVDKLAGKEEQVQGDGEGVKSYRVIYEMISELNASLNYQRVLEKSLDVSARILADPENQQGKKIVSAVWLYSTIEGGETVLSVGSSRRFTPADKRITLPGTEGLLGLTIDEGVPRLTDNVNGDEELKQVVALRACKVAYCIPLRSGLNTYGVLLFAHPEEDYFSGERQEILDIVGNQVVIAMQNARLYSDLEIEKERIMEIQEDSRKKLARDLHDGPTQSVAALAMRANFARRLLERDKKTAADELYKVEDLARKTTKEIRHMLFTLRPLVLESQGLDAALQSMAEKMQETYNQNVVIDTDADVIDRLAMTKQGIIFYIAEEAVNNARKHAQAEQVWVKLMFTEDDVALLSIKDDGTGFDLESVDAEYESRGSLGIVNMRERAELINSIIQIDSNKEKGTRISVYIPLTEAASDRLRRG